MTSILTMLSLLHKDEEGQGLVEYFLLVLLVAFGAVAGMNSLASVVNVAFSSIGSILNSYIP